MPQPLMQQLGQLYVAHVIEIDNELESRAAHRTTVGTGAGSGPWLTSYVMWANLLQWLGTEPRPLADVADVVGLVNLAGLRRWRLVTVDESAGRRAAMIALTTRGAATADDWAPLPALVQQRWAERFGHDSVDALLQGLTDAEAADDRPAPPAMPVIAPQKREGRLPATPPSAEHGGNADLVSRLARVLYRLTEDFERGAPMSAAVWLGVVRVLVEPMRAPTLVERSGLSREAVATCVAMLRSRGFVEETPSEGARGRAVRLTTAGERLRTDLPDRMAYVDRAAAARGVGTGRLAAAAQGLLDDRAALADGLRPHASGWRARTPYLRQTERRLAGPSGHLPAYPMVLHRGGYPDGC